MIGTIKDAACGVDPKHMLFVLWGFCLEHREQAAAFERNGYRAASRLQEGRQDVDILNERITHRRGLDLTGPASYQRGLQSRVVTGPFGEGEPRALLGGDDDQRIVSQVMFVEKIENVADLAIEIGDFRQIARQRLPRRGCVHEMRWKDQFIWGIARRITLVPGTVWFVGAGEQAEWGLPACAFTEKPINTLEIGVVLVARIFEIKDGAWVDVSFTTERYPVTKRLQVLDHTLGTLFDKGVVGVGTTFYWVQAGVDVVASGGTHRRCLETVRESHAGSGQLVDPRRMCLAAITSDIAKGTVVGNHKQKVRWRCGNGYRCRQAAAQGSQGNDRVSSSRLKVCRLLCPHWFADRTVVYGIHGAVCLGFWRVALSR